MKVVPVVFELCAKVCAFCGVAKVGDTTMGLGSLSYLTRLLSVQIIEKITRTVPILKSNFREFFLGSILKFLHTGRVGALSIQKNEEVTRTVPILKSNSTLNFFFYDGY